MYPTPELTDAGGDPRRPSDNFAKYLELVNNCEQNEPLLSETPLGRCLDQLRLTRVEPDQLIQLYQALNVEQLIPTQTGLARDYRGLAELMGFNLVELEARFKRSHNPAKCLIEAFADKRRRQGLLEATLNDLLKFLETLERFDIIDDFLPTLIVLAQQELQTQREHKLHVSQLGSNHDDSNKSKTLQSSAQSTLDTHQLSVYNPFSNITTSQNGRARYDAFICFADEDEDYARELILLLERHNKRVVTKEHLLPGQFEYDALVQTIATECRKVIILLTPNFLLSRECEFQTKFANEIAIKSGWFPKIIPVLCEPFDDSRLPPLIRVISKIDMTNRRANNQEWQLRKLLGSLEYNSGLQESPGAGMFYEPGDRFNHFSSRTNSASGPEQSTTMEGYTQRADCQTDSGKNHTNSTEPIIDLAYSQSSDSAMNLSCQLSMATSNVDDHQLDQATHKQQQQQSNSNNHYEGQKISGTRCSILSPSNPTTTHHQQAHSPSPSSTPTNQLNPLNWYKSFKRKILPRSPCESLAPTSSSRAQLLPERGDDKS